MLKINDVTLLCEWARSLGLHSLQDLGKDLVKCECLIVNISLGVVGIIMVGNVWFLSPRFQMTKNNVFPAASLQIQ